MCTPLQGQPYRYGDHSIPLMKCGNVAPTVRRRTPSKKEKVGIMRDEENLSELSICVAEKTQRTPRREMFIINTQPDSAESPTSFIQ